MRRELKFFAGVAIGIGIGAATGNIGIGIGIGIAFGAAFAQTKNKQKNTEKTSFPMVPGPLWTPVRPLHKHPVSMAQLTVQHVIT